MTRRYFLNSVLIKLPLPNSVMNTLSGGNVTVRFIAHLYCCLLFICLPSGKFSFFYEFVSMLEKVKRIEQAFSMLRHLLTIKRGFTEYRKNCRKSLSKLSFVLIDRFISAFRKIVNRTVPRLRKDGYVNVDKI